VQQGVDEDSLSYQRALHAYAAQLRDA
jgi:hypothetical protein